jgi:hypothetical protein
VRDEPPTHCRYQHYDCADISKDKLPMLGNVLTEIYRAKLAWRFPERPCHVEFLIPDDEDDLVQYQISFWQRHKPDGAG